MNQQKLETIANALEGVSKIEWSRIKQNVDMMYSYEAAKVELGDTAQLKRNLEVEFNLRRFGETEG